MIKELKIADSYITLVIDIVEEDDSITQYERKQHLDIIKWFQNDSVLDEIIMEPLEEMYQIFLNEQVK